MVACVVICVCHNLQFPDFVRLLDFHLHRQYEHVVLVVQSSSGPEHELILLLHFARGLTRHNRTTKSFPSTNIIIAQNNNTSQNDQNYFRAKFGRTDSILREFFRVVACFQAVGKI